MIDEMRHIDSDPPDHPSDGKLEGGVRLQKKIGAVVKHGGKFSPNRPLISVVTVVRNGADSIEKTIQSVLHQTFDNIEYIIIDGSSTDGTLDIIRKYEDKVAYWLSEPDHGIYDAMNKSIALVTGDWINFMNAGDLFYRDDVVADLFGGVEVTADVLYGDHQVIYDAKHSKVKKAGGIRDLWKGMMFCHQSLFVRTALMKSHNFNLRFKIAADFEVLYTLFLSDCVFLDTGMVIASVSASGLSGKHTLQTVKEQWMVVRSLSNGIFKNMFYTYMMIMRLCKNMAKALLARDFLNRFRVRI